MKELPHMKELFTFTQCIMSDVQQEITRHTKSQNKTQFEETEPDSDMTEMLELSDQDFKTMMNMLRA